VDELKEDLAEEGWHKQEDDYQSPQFLFSTSLILKESNGEKNTKDLLLQDLRSR